MAAQAKRTKTITVWLTEAEYTRVNELKTQARTGAWVRETILGVEPKKTKKVKTADPDLLYRLARMGGNLNQIAYGLNVHKRYAGYDKQYLTLQEQAESAKPFESYDRVRILAELATIRHQLDELLKIYAG